MKKIYKSSVRRNIRSYVRYFFARKPFVGSLYPSPAEKLFWAIWKVLGFSIKTIVCLMLIGALAQIQFGTAETKQLYGAPGSTFSVLMTVIFITVLGMFCALLFFFHSEKMFPEAWPLGTGFLLCTAMFMAFSPQIFCPGLEAISEGLLPFIVVWAIAKTTYAFLIVIGTDLAAGEDQNTAVQAVTIGIQMVECGSSIWMDVEKFFNNGFSDSIE